MQMASFMEQRGSTAPTELFLAPIGSRAAPALIFGETGPPANWRRNGITTMETLFSAVAGKVMTERFGRSSIVKPALATTGSFGNGTTPDNCVEATRSIT